MKYEKLLQLTEKSHISKEEEKCIIDENYNPDKEIIKLILNQIKCTLPWSEIKIEGMKQCKSKNDFDNYLKMIFERQQDMKQVPPKCKFKTWKPIPYSVVSTSGKKSSIAVMLTVLASKVTFCEKSLNFEVMF